MELLNRLPGQNILSGNTKNTFFEFIFLLTALSSIRRAGPLLLASSTVPRVLRSMIYSVCPLEIYLRRSKDFPFASNDCFSLRYQ